MAASLPPGARLADYVFERLVGEGGMGVVYLAREETLGRPVALKLLTPEFSADELFRERFLEEMRLAASLEHPHVCPVYAAGEEDGVLYLALRFVDGEDAARLVGREGPLRPERAVALLRDLAGALDQAHARGLLHRDVKPENVLIDADGNAYLADFGLARPLRRTQTAAEGDLAGTPLYLAPELIAGDEASPSSDQYAFACVAYFLIAGVPPFERSHEAALLFAHLRDDVPSLGERGLARLDPVFQRALAKRPVERYETCAAFATALSDALAGPDPAVSAWPEAFPRPRTTFVGRRRELEELEAIVLEGTRLLTLTGPGGTGKTRLSLELAVRLAPRYGDDVAWVALGSITDPALLLPQIANVVAGADMPAEQAIGADKEFLLCLDNVEQLLPDASTQLAALVERCPRLTLLSTSRSPLRVEREQEYQVPPLDESEAAALFQERAAKHGTSDAGADMARAICARLDCLPLAVELAAARLSLLPPPVLLQRLEARLPLLTAGPRDAPSRQRTLAATIDWSYDLLGVEEQALFARLSVFHGGFNLEAAEHVAGAELEPLATLVEASLVRRRPSSVGDARFDLLAVIREYAAAKLADESERFRLNELHCDFYAAWVERARMEAAEALEQWTALIRDELPNIRASLGWAAEHGDSTRFAHLVWQLSRFWNRFGLGPESRDWAQRALAAIGDEPSENRAGCLNVLGTAEFTRANYARAQEAFEQSARIWRLLGEKAQLSKQLNNLGGVAIELGDVDRALTLFEEAMKAAREAHDDREELAALGHLGVVHSLRGEHARAARVFEDVASTAERIHDNDSRAWALSNLGSTREQLGEYEKAETALAEALALLDRLEWKDGLVYTLSALAHVASARDEPIRGVRLLSAAERLGESIGLAWQTETVQQKDGTVALLHELLGPTFGQVWADAALVSVEDVIAQELGAAAHVRAGH